MYARTDANASKMLKAPAKSATSRRSNPKVQSKVGHAINDTRGRDDEAIREYSKKFDNCAPETYLLSPAQLNEIIARVPKQLQAADRRFRLRPGVGAGHGTNEVGVAHSLREGDVARSLFGAEEFAHSGGPSLYSRGKYPLMASAHMTIITAKVAGVERVVAFAPNIPGDVRNVTVAEKAMAGTHEIYLLGGVQTVEAMTIGTNYLLSTGSADRNTGGLCLEKYLRTDICQEAQNLESSLLIGELCGRASRVKRFEGHARWGHARVAKYWGSVLPWSENQLKILGQDRC